MSDVSTQRMNQWDEWMWVNDRERVSKYNF